MYGTNTDFSTGSAVLDGAWWKMDQLHDSRPGWSPCAKWVITSRIASSFMSLILKVHKVSYCVNVSCWEKSLETELWGTELFGWWTANHCVQERSREGRARDHSHICVGMMRLRRSQRMCFPPAASAPIWQKETIGAPCLWQPGTKWMECVFLWVFQLWLTAPRQVLPRNWYLKTVQLSHWVPVFWGCRISFSVFWGCRISSVITVFTF